VVFLTDGMTGTDREILEAIEPVVGAARIHTLGIGSSVNHYLLDRMARLGRGHYISILPEENVTQAVDRFHAWVTRPYLTDLEIDWGILPVDALSPDPVPDLGSGQTLTLVGRYLHTAEDEVVVRGKLGGVYWEQRLHAAFPEREEANAALASIWARWRIAALLLAARVDTFDAVEEEVTRLGLDHRLVSPYTSFVLVDETRTVDRDGKTPVVHQAVPAPEAGGDLEERIVVMGADSVVSLATGGCQTTSFSDDFIGDLPMLGRTYQAVLAKSPGIHDVDGILDAHGARGRDFQSQVDGVSNTDPLTGAPIVDIHPNGIAEVEVVGSGADTGHASASGGFAKVITKSGGNDFEGTASLFYRSSRLDGNGATGLPRDSFDHQGVNASVTFLGPLWRNHLWFSLSHRYLDDTDPAVFTDGTIVDRTFNGWHHRDRLTWQASARNKLDLISASSPLERGGLGVGALTSTDSGYIIRQDSPTFQLRWTVPYSPVFGWAALVTFSDVTISWDPETPGQRNTCVSDPAGWLDPLRRFGQPIDEDFCVDGNTGRGTGSFWRELEDDRRHWTFEIKGEKFLPEFVGADHRFRAGVRIEDLTDHYEWEEHPRSIFEFYDPNQLQGGRIYREAAILPARYRIQTLFDRTVSAEGRRYAAWIEDSFRPLPNLSIRVGLRFQREELRSHGYRPFSPEAEYHAFFRRYNSCMENFNWNPIMTPRCRFLASHVFTAYENDIYVPLLEIVRPRRPSKVREPEHFSIVDASLAPRLSVSWDPWNNGRTKVFATWGRYHGELPLLPLTAERGPAFIGQGLDVRPTVQQLPDGSQVIEQEVESVATETTAFSISQVDRKLRSPFTDELTLGIERELAAETSLGITYIHRKFRRQLQDRDVNHYTRDRGDHCLYDPHYGEGTPAGEPDGVPDDCVGRRIIHDWDPFGRPIYRDVPDGRPDLYLYNPLFNQVQLLGNFNESDYEAVQIALRRRFYRNWKLEASYVWSRAKSVADLFDPLLTSAPYLLEDRPGFLTHDRRHVLKTSGQIYLPWWGGYRLGGSVTWESGMPYSRREYRPVFDARSDHAGWRFRYFRNMTVYRTRERNDQRSESYWTIDIGLEKEFEIGPTVWQARIELLNLLNDDRLRILSMANGHLDGELRFGRQYRLGLTVNF
jgi:hypothetical protein